MLCLGTVEDEFHFLCHIPVYSDLRSSIFGTVQLENPDDLIWLSAGDMISWFGQATNRTVL